MQLNKCGDAVPISCPGRSPSRQAEVRFMPNCLVDKLVHYLGGRGASSTRIPYDGDAVTPEEDFRRGFEAGALNVLSANWTT